MKHLRTISFLLIATCVITLCAVSIFVYSLNKKGSISTKIEISQAQDGRTKNINITVPLSQAMKDIYPIVIEDFLSQTKLLSVAGGLKLADFQNTSVLSKYGFKKGDIIKKIDGQTINSTGEAIKICERIEKDIFGTKDAKELKVMLDRNGDDVNMNFKIPAFVPQRVSYKMCLQKRSAK